MASPAPRNLLNLQNVGISFGGRPILRDVSCGVNAGDRIGIVGRNGDGKSTLLKLMAGALAPDDGVVTRTGTVTFARVAQDDEFDPTHTVEQALMGDRDTHEWAGDRRFRDVLDGLLGGVGIERLPDGLHSTIGTLSGGERRRIALAKLLIDDPELLLLDEPTNHLDIDAVDWLAAHLARRRGSLVVITHDRWFLDAVCTHTWEVVDQGVQQYDGGYAAYVLARAERERQAAARDSRRRNLLRKELAWLRRGPPARTSKPKFRIDAANDLIADEPPARDSVELVRFAASRLGDRVIDIEHARVAFGDAPLFDDLTWRLGPGDRVALVGANGSGKTTLVRIVVGDLLPDAGTVERGATVRVAHLSQNVGELPEQLRVIEALDEVRQTATTSDGMQQSSGQLAERFGFRGPKAATRVRELSGGERRRLQLMRLLMDEPNVLILDEPTNDLDIDTLTALEDLLDTWPGTLVVISHDRYFVERVCDDVYMIDPGAGIRHLPRGIEQYVDERHAAMQVARDEAARTTGDVGPPAADTSGPSNAQVRQARKDVQRIERQLGRVEEDLAALDVDMARAASDHEQLLALAQQRSDLVERRDELERAWIAAAEIAGEE